MAKAKNSEEYRNQWLLYTADFWSIANDARMDTDLQLEWISAIKEVKRLILKTTEVLIKDGTFTK